ncbi:MAG: nitrilase-related carbon-nitrogen hydrolase [Promethearchaeota archaeon]
MKIAAVQMHPRFANPERNRSMMRRYCEKAARQEVELVIFPELCVSGYNFTSMAQVHSLAEVIPEGPTSQLLIKQAEQYSLTIVAGIAEQGMEKRVYNSAVVIGPQGFLGQYRKIHLFAREKEWFTPGNEPPQVWSIPKAVIGVLVCFDWAFPEASRILMLEGCEILCLPSNLVLPYAQQAMITRSIENRIFTVVANRIGTERTLTFTGRSQITSPKGAILARGQTQRTGLIVAKINPKQAKDKFLTKTNHIIEDRRIKLYDRLMHR